MKLAPEKSVNESAVPDKSTPDKSEPVNFALTRLAPLRSRPANPAPYATPFAAASVLTVMLERSTPGPMRYPPRIWYPEPD